jgi:hypothetical protein
MKTRAVVDLTLATLRRPKREKGSGLGSQISGVGIGFCSGGRLLALDVQ